MIAPHSGKRVKSVSAKHVPDMPRIPTLMHVFPTFGFGGSQVRFAAIANHFGRTFRHLVLAMDGSYECMGRIEKGVEVERVVVPIRKRSTLRNAFVFRRFLHLRRPDVLVTYNWGAIEWALANWPQFVRHVHIEDGFGSEEAEVQFFRRVLSRRIALVRSTVVLPSQSLYRLARNTWKLPPDRTRHIANGIDCARFALTPETIAVPTGRGPVIGMVAALRPEKNIGRLLRVVRRVAAMTPCRLLIAGDGTERGKLEDLAGQLLPPGSYAFIGHFDEIERFYASIDLTRSKCRLWLWKRWRRVCRWYPQTWATSPEWWLRKTNHLSCHETTRRILERFTGLCAMDHCGTALEL
jgi:glycosyltransferase involved in cell wall biosynthesis